MACYSINNWLPRTNAWPILITKLTHNSSPHARFTEAAPVLSSESAELFEPQLADYHNYTELMEELDSLVEEFPDLARLYSLGQTHEDRDLAVIQITQGVNEVKYELSFLYPVSRFYCALRFP